MPIKTTNKYNQALVAVFLFGDRFIFHGIEHNIAEIPILIPMIFNVLNCSPNNKKAATIGMNNDRRSATSVRTIPLYLIDKARITKSNGNNIPNAV